MGQKCPYSQLYERVRSTSPQPPEGGASPFLPVDDRGACIFHSQALAWKRQNDFTGKFLQLVQLLNEHDAESYYDFTEFVFQGSDLITKNGAQQYPLRISDVIFPKHAYFTGALFLDSFTLEHVEFHNGASFNHAVFHDDLTFENAQFRGLDFREAKFSNGVTFREVESLSFALFSEATFEATRNSALVYFKKTRFAGITDFSAADFTLSDQGAVSFENVQFEDVAVFRNTHFNCQVDFSDVTFANKTDFIDTSFDIVRSTARYRGAALEFNRLRVTSEAELSFISTDPHRKMFNHDVEMSFNEDPSGSVRFENVNFNLFSLSSKQRLTQLAKSGSVEIGPGCIKYRFQTEVQTISVSESNVGLILELCQTFTNYFTGSNGLNLGFEIVERNKTRVSFFYFTDEDISEETFRERLAKTKQSLWDLLSIESEEQMLALQGPTAVASSTENASAVINAIDAISALLGTFFRVGARIALRKWTEADTAALLNAIPSNQESARSRASSLHQLLIDRYTRQTLLDINVELNKRLFLEGKVAALDHTVKLLANKGNTYVMGDKYEVTGSEVGGLAVGPHSHVHEISARTGNRVEPLVKESNAKDKIKILFLASNPTDTSALRLGEEVRQIDEKISNGSKRESFELIQQHAVRVTDLQRVLLKHDPHIVHFCGHGSATEELMFEDQLGRSKPVTREALTQLFRILRDNVRVVVLNACYSKSQAEALNEVIDYTIGMNKGVGDQMAISFAGAFYQALAFDRTVTEAFELAKVEVDLVRLAGSDTPEVFVSREADVKKCFVSQKHKGVR
jgi:uncharacterized protein YjbI with pentapeptide repeats